MTTSLLCVGGHCAGQYVDVHKDQDFYRVMEESHIGRTPADFTNPPLGEAETRGQIYKRDHFFAGEQEFFLLRPTTMSLEDAVLDFFSRYAPSIVLDYHRAGDRDIIEMLEGAHVD